jgi:branched-chain amino acid transport system permease protein
MNRVQGKILMVLVALTTLVSCNTVDLNQATLCEAVAEILFAENHDARLATATDPSADHAVITHLIPRQASDTARHRVSCGFESSNAKSADLLSLTSVATDIEGQLSAARLAELRSTLERKGIYWKVSWVPHLGPPHGELAPLPPRVALLYFLQLLLNALTYGSIIALLAIGYTVISGVIGVFNLAFGDIYMIGAFVAVAAIGVATMLGVGPFALCVVVALPVIMAITAGYSAVSDRLVFRPLRRSSPQMPLIASIGLSLVLQNFVFVTAGAHDLWLTAPVASGFVVAEADGFNLYANREQIALIGMTLVLVGAASFMMARTSFGRAQRACAQDRHMAALLGIDVDRVIAFTFAFGGAFAAAGGLIAAAYYGSVHYVMGVMMGLKAITAAVVGGTGNVNGAVLGGFAVALLESLAAGYFFAAYRDLAVFALLILLLIFRPQGILGEA